MRRYLYLGLCFVWCLFPLQSKASQIAAQPISNLAEKSSLRGSEGFDVELRPGEKAVFFLRGLDSGKGTLTHWGSVARFADFYFE